ncbi:MAG: hypothetical protein U0938_05380 [Thiobacillus sp.]|nr:hypothetical protein [Thiobacillus sp.]
MTLYEYLGNELREDIPGWLDNFRSGDRFPREQFFSSRVVYYPGSGNDGHPVKLFGSTHSAHCFVYADYGMAQNDLESKLEDPSHSFRGYHTLARLQLGERDLVPAGWSPHVQAGEAPRDRQGFAAVASAPFGFLEVLERDDEFDDNHGARRLAILFLGADGIAAYDALFCQELHHSPPFAVLLEDHGFGGNYDRFGRGGLLERIAVECDVVPRWLLAAKHTVPWNGFERVPGVDADCGGMHATPRFLHERREK